MERKAIGAVVVVLAALLINGCATSDGVGGLLDKPSEVCLRGKRIYVANIDLPFDDNEYDTPHTISVLKLK